MPTVCYFCFCHIQNDNLQTKVEILPVATQAAPAGLDILHVPFVATVVPVAEQSAYVEAVSPAAEHASAGHKKRFF